MYTIVVLRLVNITIPDWIAKKHLNRLGSFFFYVFELICQNFLYGTSVTKQDIFSWMETLVYNTGFEWSYFFHVTNTKLSIPKIFRDDTFFLNFLFKKNSHSTLRCTISKRDDKEFVYDNHMGRRPSGDGTHREHYFNALLRVSLCTSVVSSGMKNRRWHLKKFKFCSACGWNVVKRLKICTSIFVPHRGSPPILLKKKNLISIQVRPAEIFRVDIRVKPTVRLHYTSIRPIISSDFYLVVRGDFIVTQRVLLDLRKNCFAMLLVGQTETVKRRSS